MNKHPQLQNKAFNISQTILDISYNAHVGHIGSSLSISDILTVLYFEILKEPEAFTSPTRDRFILSKGHAAAALYSALYHRGILSEKEIKSFANANEGLCEHPEKKTPGVEMTSGSLGYGLGYGAGVAFALKKRYIKESRVPHVFILISDGECGEGSIWEAAIFISQHKLNNITIIIDNNGWQCFGNTKDITNLSPLEKKWSAFGFETQISSGHDLKVLSTHLKTLSTNPKRPTVLIAQTIAGHGVSFFENQLAAHYTTLTDEQYKQANEDLKNTYA